MNEIHGLRVKLFADGADLAGIREMAADPRIKGFTTNPTLMRKAGINDYAGFAKSALGVISDRPISFEVFADDFDLMERQAHTIAAWGTNVNVKIPVTNTRGEFCGPAIRRLCAAGVKVNVTAVMTLDQVEKTSDSLDRNTPAFVSVFAGRIADTGRDPIPVIRESLRILRDKPLAELIWASPRELLNVFQANEAGCHVITATNDILKKLAMVGKDLTEYSLETVKMFWNDAATAGYSIADEARSVPSA